MATAVRRKAAESAELSREQKLELYYFMRLTRSLEAGHSS